MSLIYDELKQNPKFLNFSELQLSQYFCKINDNCEWFKHYENGELAGFIAFYCNDTLTKQAFITLILVASKYRGLGIAKKMLAEVFVLIKSKGFKSCALEVKINNFDAIHVYASLGFGEDFIKDESLFMSVNF